MVLRHSLATSRGLPPNAYDESYEVAKLRVMATERYAQDRGVMKETFENADYDDEIATHKTAEAAWAYHLRIVDAQCETQGVHEADAEKRSFE